MGARATSTHDRLAANNSSTYNGCPEQQLRGGRHTAAAVANTTTPHGQHAWPTAAVTTGCSDGLPHRGPP